MDYAEEEMMHVARTKRKGVFKTDKIMRKKVSITNKYDNSVREDTSLKKEHPLSDKKIFPFEYDHAMSPKRGAAAKGIDEVRMVHGLTAGNMAFSLFVI
ncbi:hypothetical protein DPMN_162943 [Dreissena polymorpha]|uniref:Uncharacterized protein n=1 Tax=Dreissena polymorpha TaxID=45954 RepID=A0A9D4EUV4_DREPO|nr:hypothetical protein DPMN_162943 [Dreissena polymorpha]